MQVYHLISLGNTANISNMILKVSLIIALVACAKKRVDFKIACLIFKSLNNLPPSYIQDLLEIYKPTRAMRPSASISLKTSIPPNSFVGRAFSFNAPKIGNNVSHGTRSCASFQSFKKCLKTESFKLYIGF